MPILSLPSNYIILLTYKDKKIAKSVCPFGLRKAKPMSIVILSVSYNVLNNQNRLCGK